MSEVRAENQGEERRDKTVDLEPAEPVVRRRSTFWLAFWLGVALVACKAYHLGMPGAWSGRPFEHYLRNLLIISHMDVVYALAIGLVGQLLLALTARWPGAQRVVWGVLAATCAISVGYGVAAARIFEILRMPLTYALLYVAGDVKNMRSSVGAFISPQILAVVIGAPVVYGILVWMTARGGPGRRPWWVRVGQAAAVALIAAVTVWGQGQIRGVWGAGHDDRRVADNPHYVLAASFARQLLGEKSIVLKEDYPPEFLDDFRVVSERPAGAAEPTAGVERGPKNVIVVVLESVGTQFLSLYGSPYKTTPRLEAEAAHSVVYDHFYSHITNTPNSLVALSLSTYPPLSWKEYTVERPDMPGTTVAQALKPLGYRTAFISSADNEFSNQNNFLKNRGFDTVWDYRDSDCKFDPDLFSWGVQDKCMVDMVLKWVDQGKEKKEPFYVMAWTQGTHHPYEPLEGYEEHDFIAAEDKEKKWAWDLGRYLNALYEMDKQLGRLFDELRARGLAEDTIVVVTGDHGEAFGIPRMNNWGHSGKVYEENVHVPFLIWSPALFKSGTRTDTVGAHVDVSPTVLDLLGVKLPGTWQGKSLYDPARPPRAYMYGAMDDYILGVREGNWKYVFNATVGRDELYDVVADPQEQRNVVGEHAAKAKEMRGRIAAWMDYQRELVESEWKGKDEGGRRKDEKE